VSEDRIPDKKPYRNEEPSVDEQTYREWIPAYALGTLEEEDLQILEAHLAKCEACREELQAYQAVAQRLALAVPLREPPPGLRAAILAQAAHSKNPQGVPMPATRKQPGGLERFRLWFTHPAVGIALLVVIVALLISNLWVWQRLNRLEAEYSTPPRLVQLTGTQFAPEAGGVFVLRPGARDGTLIADGLPVLPQDRQYQLWLIKDGQRTSGGTFSIGASGYAALQVNSPEPLSNYQNFGITVEPYGGSSGPTGNKVLGGNL
jgi:anti-sigma-K factor RskA